jgi:hypothetical protein
VIRSLVLNLLLGLIGLLFLAAGTAYAVEDIQWAGWRGLFHAYALLLGVMNLSLGIWCTLGAIRNLRARRHSYARQLSLPERTAAGLAALMALSIVAFLASMWRAEGSSASVAPFYRHLGQASGIIFLESLVAVPFVASWVSRQRVP